MTPSALRLLCLAHVLLTRAPALAAVPMIGEEKPTVRADRIYAWASALGPERGKERLHCWQIAEARHGAHDRRPIEEIATEFWAWANPEGKAAAADFEAATPAGETSPGPPPADKAARTKNARASAPAARA